MAEISSESSYIDEVSDELSHDFMDDEEIINLINEYEFESNNVEILNENENVLIIDEIINENMNEYIVNINDIDFIYPNNTMILGPTLSGKSNVICNLLAQYMHRFKIVVIFGHSDLTINHPGLIKKKYVSIKLLQHLMIMGEDEDEDEENNNVLVVLDDVMSQIKRPDKDFWDDYCSRCRHSNISNIFSVQYLFAILPCMRSNLRYIIICDITHRDLGELTKVTSYDRKEIKRLVYEEKQGYNAVVISNVVDDKYAIVVEVDLIEYESSYADDYVETLEDLEDDEDKNYLYNLLD